MPLVHWVRFTWELASLPATAPAIDSCYLFGEAKPVDAEALHTALTRAYTAEVAWSTDLDERLRRVNRLVEERLADGTADFLVLRHGPRIIAGSILIDNPEASEHLASGVGVMDEYRCRGLGTFLLHQSLARLKAAGLSSASVTTKEGVTAERYLYGKYGAKRTPITAEEPAAG